MCVPLLAMPNQPCVRCLHPKIKRVRAGENKEFAIIQCAQCGFNVTSKSFLESEEKWNGFRVWELVQNREVEDGKKK